jgi:adenylate cyclase
MSTEPGPRHPDDVPPGTDTVPDTAAREALDRVLASARFRTSPRTSAFLRFVADETLRGRGGRLRERVIATEALGRGHDFDPRMDPAVRVQAGRVRRALERYYAEEGAGEPVRIGLSAGGYAPVFTYAAPPPAQATGATRGPGLVVLSLADLTPGGGPAPYLATGLSEVLTATLAAYPGLRVIGPVRVPGDPVHPDLGELGRAHGADYVLTGSTRIAGATLRVSVRLVETDAGETLWARVFDGPLEGDGSFSVEDAIVAQTAAVVADYRGIVNLRTSPRMAAAVDPVVRDAQRRYYGWLATTAPAQFPATVRALEAAAAREPDNPLVLGMLAGMYLVDAFDRIAGLERPAERAAELVDRAIAVDPLNPHALAALAFLELSRGNVASCHQHMEQVLHLCPEHPTFLYRAGFIFAVSGRWDDGVALIERSLRLNPQGPGYLNFFPAMDLCLRGDDEAALHRAVLVHTPGGHLGPLCRAVPLARLGRLDEARAEFAALRAAAPGFDDDRDAALRRMLMPEPVRQAALRALDAVEASPNRPPGA